MAFKDMKEAERIVTEAVPELEWHEVRATEGRDGLPNTLVVGGVFTVEGKAENEPDVKPAFTFFDDRDLRRIALGLGRKRQADLEATIAHRERGLAEMKASAAAQAEACAKVEGELTR